MKNSQPLDRPATNKRICKIDTQFFFPDNEHYVNIFSQGPAGLLLVAADKRSNQYFPVTC